ncbi:hypothetical protein [Acidovorax sp. Q11]
MSTPSLLEAPAPGSDLASIDLRLAAIEACMADLLALCLKVTEGGVALRVVGRP